MGQHHIHFHSIAPERLLLQTTPRCLNNLSQTINKKYITLTNLKRDPHEETTCHFIKQSG